MDAITNIKLLPDLRLLELLCSEENDADIYSEFVNRFLPDVNAECERICNTRKLNSHIGTQIAHETVERVRKYKSFKSDKINISNSRKAIVVYLNRISTSLFNDHYKKEKHLSANHRSYFDDIVDSIDPKIDIESLKSKKDFAVQLFQKLNKKEQRVVTTDIEYKRHQKYLPDDVNETLSKELGIKKETVRKIRERAIKKLINGINEINKN